MQQQVTMNSASPSGFAPTASAQSPRIPCANAVVSPQPGDASVDHLDLGLVVDVLLAQRDREIIESIGIFVSKGIENLERIEELISDRENYSKINDLLARIDINTPANDVFDHVRNLCRSLFSYDKLTISMQAGQEPMATIHLVDGFDEDINIKGEFPVEGTLHGRPIRTGKPVRSSYWENDYEDEGRFIIEWYRMRHHHGGNGQSFLS